MTTTPTIAARVGRHRPAGLQAGGAQKGKGQNMTKHTSIAIRGDDLYNRIDAQTDEQWRDVMRWDSESGLIERLEDRIKVEDDDELLYDLLDHLDQIELDKMTDTWWVVSWPEHVITPSYDSDARYTPMGEFDAIAEADEVFG